MGALTYAVSEMPAIPWGEIVPNLVLTVLLGSVLIVSRRRSRNGPGSGFGRSRARRFVGQPQQVTFDDVAGAVEAKEELLEIVEFLKAPEKFTAMGARIPKGVLLVGPRQSITVMLDVSATRVQATATNVRCTSAKAQSCRRARLLLATGRQPSGRRAM